MATTVAIAELAYSYVTGPNYWQSSDDEGIVCLQVLSTPAH